MRGLLITLVCLTVAAPASAKTYNGMAFAGPAISGDSVAWGTVYSDGSGAVKVDGRIVARFEAPVGEGRDRGFGGVPGAIGFSPTRLVYALADSRNLPGGDGDSGASALEVTPMLSSGGGPFTNPLPCTGPYVSTAVDGDTVLIGVSTQPPCAGVYLDGRKISDVSPCQVRIAGPYIAWREGTCGGSQRLVVADRTTGTVLATFSAPSLRRAWGPFDLDEQGNVVAAQGDGVVAFSLADPKPRVLATKTWSSTVATAGGRAAFISTDADYGPHRLLLVDLDGKVLKRLERYGKRRWPEGEIALTDRWVAWSVKRTIYDHPTGPGNVFLKQL
ncbi:hypothetical protein OJ998_29610 [Solirubrobacter taibaiensis]|nr:hypothetical protein [Solirubrobacter taibaiensis]